MKDTYTLWKRGNMQIVDVEKIMDEIRREIADKGYKEEDLHFEDIALSAEEPSSLKYSRADAEKQLDYLSFHSNNPVFFPLSGNPIKTFVQRVVRRFFLFVIYPAFQFQNKHNATVTRFLKQTMNYMNENEELKEQLRKQQEQIDRLSVEVAGLRGCNITGAQEIDQPGPDYEGERKA